MDPSLTCHLAAQYIQDRMVAAETARSVREATRSTAREPKRRRFGRRSSGEALAPAAAARVVVPPSH